MTADPTDTPTPPPIVPTPLTVNARQQFEVAWADATDRLSAVGVRAEVDAEHGDRAAESHDFSELSQALTAFSTTLRQLPLDAQHAQLAPVQANTDALIALVAGGAQDPAHADYDRFMTLIDEWTESARNLAIALEDA